MIAHWAEKYVGIPWAAGGRTVDGCDCWGLVRLVLADQLEFILPSYSGVDPMAADEVGDLFLAEWPLPGIREVTGQPYPGDVLLFRVAGEPCHVGIACGDARFLHIRPGCGAVLERLDCPRWCRRLQGVYRVE